jgi:Flp pilus assembly pilin Flp
MKRLKCYARKFLYNESGSELVQWAVVIAIAVVLAAIAVAISQSAGNKLNDAKDFIDQLPIPTIGP